MKHVQVVVLNEIKYVTAHSFKKACDLTAPIPGWNKITVTENLGAVLPKFYFKLKTKAKIESYLFHPTKFD